MSKLYRLPTLSVFDERTLGEFLPQASDTEVCTWRYSDGTIAGYTYRRQGQYWLHLIACASYQLDSGSDSTCCYLHDASAYALARDMYWRLALPLILERRGFGVLHASAVLHPGGILGFCGRSGSGKSTTAYALSRHNFQYWADDALIFRAQGSSIEALALPFSMHLRPDASKYFGFSQYRGRERIGETNSLVSSFVPLRALYCMDRSLVPTDDEQVQITHQSTGAALRLIMPSIRKLSIQKNSFNHDSLHIYRRLVTQVPVFRLRYIPNLNNTQTIVREIAGMNLE